MPRVLIRVSVLLGLLHLLVFLLYAPYVSARLLFV